VGLDAVPALQHAAPLLALLLQPVHELLHAELAQLREARVAAQSHAGPPSLADSVLDAEPQLHADSNSDAALPSHADLVSELPSRADCSDSELRNAVFHSAASPHADVTLSAVFPSLADLSQAPRSRVDCLAAPLPLCALFQSGADSKARLHSAFASAAD